MVRVCVEVRGGEGQLAMMVRASSIRAAEGLARSRYPGCDARVVFPIDGESFFSAGDPEGVEHDFPETIAG